MIQAVARLAFLVLASAQVEPPPPAVDFPASGLTRSTVEYRCFDGGPRMTVSVDFERERHILTWRHGSKDVVPPADLKRIEAKLSVLAKISYIDGLCSNAGFDEVRVLGFDAADEVKSVSAIHAFGRLWIEVY